MQDNTTTLQTLYHKGIRGTDIEYLTNAFDLTSVQAQSICDGLSELEFCNMYVRNYCA